MLKVAIILKQKNDEDQKYWQETFNDIWEGPFELHFSEYYPKEPKADLIIIDFSKWDETGLGFLSDISKELSGKNFLIVSNKKDADIALEAIKLGTIGFLIKPIKRAELISSLSRLSAAQGAGEDSSSLKRRGKIITVSSYKGGTGVSTVTVNLAFTFSHIFHKKTLIIDACAYANHTSILLNVIPRSNISDLTNQGKNLDDEYFNNAVKEVNKNLSIIGGLIYKNESGEINIPNLKHLIDIATTYYDYILVDTAARVVDDTTMFLVRQADHILIVTTFDILTVKDNKFYIQALLELGIPEFKIKPVINRGDLYRGNMEPEILQKQINVPVFHLLPNEWETCVNATIEARPIQVLAPNGKLAKAYIALAEKIIKLDAPPDDKESPETDTEKKKGIFSWLKK